MTNKKPRMADLQPLIDADYELLPLNRPFEKRRDRRGVVREVGKAPRDSHWTQKQYESAKTVKKYGGVHNIGVKLGPEDLVIDVDVRHGGAGGLKQFRRDFPDFDCSAQPTVVTGGGGLHIYCKIPAGFRPVETLPAYSGLEFKTKGRQVVAPGSLHPQTKKFYHWRENSPDVAEAQMLPKVIRKAIKRPPPPENAPEAGEVDPDELAKMLSYLSPEDYGTNAEWLPLMMAAHQATAGAGRQEFIDWSTQDPAFADADVEIGARWDSCNPNKEGGVTARTLFKALREAGCPAHLIPGNHPGDDFDDLDEESLANLLSPSIDDREDDDECSEGAFESLGEVDPADIPTRAWQIEGVLEEEKVFGLVGPGGAGKSVFSLNIAVVLSSGKPFGPWEPADGKKRKVLIVQGEDDRHELERRIVAICKTMGVDRAKIGGRIIVDKKQKNIRLVEANAATGKRRVTKFWKRIRRAIEKFGIDAVIIDPFIKTHSGFNESDNADMQYVIEEIEKLLVGTGCSLLLIHHTSKGGNADDASAIRGASAISNALRGGHTFYPMTTTEHSTIGPPLPKELYVRITGVKQNYAAKIGARWFELVPQDIGNGHDTAVGLRLCPADFAASPEDDFAEDPAENWDRYDKFLQMIREGRPDGTRYSVGLQGTPKGSAIELLMEEFGFTKKQSRSRMQAFLQAGNIVIAEYVSPNSTNRHKLKGVFVAGEEPEESEL